MLSPFLGCDEFPRDFSVLQLVIRKETMTILHCNKKQRAFWNSLFTNQGDQEVSVVCFRQMKERKKSLRIKSYNVY